MPYQQTASLPYISLAYGLTALAILSFMLHVSLQRRKLRQLQAALFEQGCEQGREQGGLKNV